ncbi:MAG: SDR family oxidoreductase [Anaerolineales bacterium]
MTKIHVIFGTGPLGQAAARALLTRGKTVKMINRSGLRPTDLPKEIEIIPGDAYQPEFTKKVTQGAEVVYQCAQPAYHKWVTDFPPLQAAILEGVAANGAKLIVGENLYMYGDTNGQPIHEELPYAAHTRKGKVRAAMSEALMVAHRTGKVRTAMARGSDFYGPGVLGSTFGERTLIPALRGKAAEITGALDQPHSYTFINDFGEALAILGTRDEALGQAWHVPNAPARTQGELIKLVFQEIGKPVKTRRMRKLMMAFGGLFVPEARETVEMMYEFEKPFVVDDRKFTRAFGNIATPYQESIKKTVAWYRSYLEDRNQ